MSKLEPRSKDAEKLVNAAEPTCKGVKDDPPPQKKKHRRRHAGSAAAVDEPPEKQKQKEEATTRVTITNEYLKKRLRSLQEYNRERSSGSVWDGEDVVAALASKETRKKDDQATGDSKKDDGKQDNKKEAGAGEARNGAAEEDDAEQKKNEKESGAGEARTIAEENCQNKSSGEANDAEENCQKKLPAEANGDEEAIVSAEQDTEELKKRADEEIHKQPVRVAFNFLEEIAGADEAMIDRGRETRSTAACSIEANCQPRLQSQQNNFSQQQAMRGAIEETPRRNFQEQIGTMMAALYLGKLEEKKTA